MGTPNHLRIAPNLTTEVRTSLYLEDIHPEDIEAGLRMGVITKYEFDDDCPWAGYTTQVLALDINWRRFYSHGRIKDLRDPVLGELMSAYIHLNPRPTKIIKKRIVESVIRNFIAYRASPSKLVIGEKAYYPVLHFEEVLDILEYELMCWTGETRALIKWSVTLLRREDVYSKEEKLSMRSYLMTKVVHGGYNIAIRNAMVGLQEKNPLVKIKIANIHKEGTVLAVREGKNIGRPISAKAIGKAMDQENKEYMGAHNKEATFSSSDQEEKYKQWSALNGVLSLAEAAKAIHVSKDTVSFFRRLKEEEDRLLSSDSPNCLIN